MNDASDILPSPPEFDKLNPIDLFCAMVNALGPIPPHMPHLGRCWEWTGPIMGGDAIWGGYGRFKGYYAHHYVWEMTKGPIPKALWVLHRCDNPLCVNPEHLWLGTPKSNSQDRERKGRGRNQWKAEKA